MSEHTASTHDMTQAFEQLRRAMQAQSMELYRLTQVAKLAAFACEARRVLQEVEHLCAIDPVLEHRLSEGIVARRDWIEHDDSASLVLRELSDKLHDLAASADALGVGLPAAP